MRFGFRCSSLQSLQFLASGLGFRASSLRFQLRELWMHSGGSQTNFVSIMEGRIRTAALGPKT